MYDDCAKLPHIAKTEPDTLGTDLERLNRECEMLHKSVSILEERLEAVIRPNAAVAGTVREKDAEGRSPLRRAIRDRTESVQTARMRVETLANALDL